MEKEREENVLSFFKTKNGDGKEGKPFCRGRKIGKGKHIVEFFFWSWKRFGERKHLISERKEGRSRKYRKMFGKRHLVIEEKKNIEGREGKYLGTKKLGEGWLERTRLQS